MPKVGEARLSYTVYGGKILLFSDTHFSASYAGTHVNYQKECFYNMEKIIEIVKAEKPSAIIFFGDLIGVKEGRLNDRQFLMRVLLFFGFLYNCTKGHVYSVKGNHDMGDFTDFDLLVGLGYIKNPSYIDYVTESGTEIRFHFVNYGDEHKQLNLIKDGASNIVLGHADYYIDGVTNWYVDASKKLELKTLTNFCGVELILSGHIHTPSEEMLYTTLSNGESCGLFYLGSPSRVVERIDSCWYFEFEYQEESKSTSYNAKLFEMEPADSVFYPKEIKDEVSEEDEGDIAKLERQDKALDIIVQEIFENRLADGDILKQIDRIPADEDVKEIAREYIIKAINGGY